MTLKSHLLWTCNSVIKTYIYLWVQVLSIWSPSSVVTVTWWAIWRGTDTLSCRVTNRPKGTHVHTHSVQWHHQWCHHSPSRGWHHWWCHCSDADGGYMDMNKEESVEYVTMTKLSYADIEPALYETPYTPAGEVSRLVSQCVRLSVCSKRVSCHSPSDQQEAMLLLSDSPLLTLHDLLSFSFQVAQAMDFLSSRNVWLTILLDMKGWNSSCLCIVLCAICVVSFAILCAGLLCYFFRLCVAGWVLLHSDNLYLLWSLLFWTINVNDVDDFACPLVSPQRSGCEERPGLWGKTGQGLRLRFGERSDEGSGLRCQRNRQ